MKALWPDFSKELTHMIEVSSHLAAKTSSGLLDKLTGFGC